MKYFLICLLASIGVVVPMNAQWTTNLSENTLVASSVVSDCKSVGTSDGQTFVVFWKTVSAPENYELRAQLLNAQGVQKFGPDGKLVSSTIPMSTFTMLWDLAIDESDQLYIGVTGTGSGNPGFVFKMDTTGALPWGSSGMALGSGSALVPTLCPLPGGELAVSWLPGSGNAVLQKLDAQGMALWAEPVPLTTTNTATSTYPGDIFSLSNGELLVVFHAKSGAGINSNLWARKFKGTGLPQWADPVQLSNLTTRFNAQYSGTQDNDTVYFGYAAAQGLRFDGFVQRINPDGTTWEINGKDFDVAQTDYELDVRIAFQPGADHVWAICRYSNPNQSLYGEKVQKYRKMDGNRLLGDNALQVFPIDDQFRNHTADLMLYAGNPLYVIRQGLDNGASPVTLKVVRSGDDGMPMFNPDGLPVATFSASKARVTLNRPVNDQAVVVFVEEKTGGSSKIYAQPFIHPITGAGPMQAAGNIRLFPNPCRNQLTVKSAKPMASVSVVTSLGQCVAHQPGFGQVHISLLAQEMATGLYRILVTLEDGTVTSHSVRVE